MKHHAQFSHEYETGPSGPARSYWDIFQGDCKRLTICLQHTSQGHPELNATSICYALDAAFEAGKLDKANEIRRVLGVKQ